MGFFSRKEEKPTALALTRDGALARVEEDEDDAQIVIHKKPSTAIVPRKSGEVAVRKQESLVQFRPKTIVVAGIEKQVSPYELIRCIRRYTQTIGEYKGREDLYSLTTIAAARKARSDIASILEDKFKIHWKINDSGESVFVMD